MIVALKLLLSLATASMAMGYAARHRDNFLHRRLMALGVVLGWTALPVALLGAWLFGLALRPGYWLVETLGSARAAHIATGVHQGLAIAALVTLTVQAVLGASRHPAHRLLARFAIPWWLIVYVAAMFCYY